MQAGRWRAAVNIFAQMHANRIEPTVKTYTTLIKACTAAGAPDRAVALFAQMEAAGVPADLLAYNSLMSAFSRNGEWERAWSVLGAMRRAAVDPDIVSYNTLLKACQRCAACCGLRAVSVQHVCVRRRGGRPPLGVACWRWCRYDGSRQSRLRCLRAVAVR